MHAWKHNPDVGLFPSSDAVILPQYMAVLLIKKLYLKFFLGEFLKQFLSYYNYVQEPPVGVGMAIVGNRGHLKKEKEID